MHIKCAFEREGVCYVYVHVGERLKGSLHPYMNVFVEAKGNSHVPSSVTLYFIIIFR